MRQSYGMQRLGQSCLLARRLIEAGCPFVTVTDPTWDTHQQIFRTLKEGFVGGTNGKIPQLDTALSALIRDLEGRILAQEAAGDEAGAAELRDALRLGRLLLAGHEVTL